MLRIVPYGAAAFEGYLRALPRAGSMPASAERTAARILRDVARHGDRALLRLTERLDGVTLQARQLRVTAREIRALARRAEPAVVGALGEMARRVEAFHRRQRRRGFRLSLGRGSWLEEVVRPLDSVGLYVPGGGGAYPSSVVMNAIPARLAGVPRISVVTPPRTLETNPAVAAALVLVGLEDRVYRVGGAQAIAALAYGTKTLAPVSKIVGPGNAFVAAAKRLVRGRVEIDHEAGPSELVILADDSADPGFVAADLLAQAEHGSGGETLVLVTPSMELAREVCSLVELGIGSVAHGPSVRRALARHGAVVRVRDLEDGVRAVNALAAEHVQVLTRGASSIARRVVGGAVFVGPYSPSVAGDYGIGPNHVLPTGGTARRSSPLSVSDFQRTQSLVHLTPETLRRLAGGLVRLARAEGFPGHAQSVLARLEGVRA